MKRLLMCVMILAVAGCGPKATTTMQREAIAVESARFSVQRAAVFDDEIAYNGKRGIYLIRDKETGREYVGVSGIGVAERSAHAQPAGKSVVTVGDER